MEYLGPFADILQKYGLVVALLSALFLAGLYVVVKYATNHIEEAREMANKRLELETADLAARELERQALMEELKAAREQNLKIVENHLAHDKEDREALIRVLTKMESTLEATSETMTKLSQDNTSILLELRSIEGRLS